MDIKHGRNWLILLMLNYVHWLQSLLYIDEFFQLLLIRNWQQWEKEKAALGTCQHCGKSKSGGGCGGEFQKETYQCWLAQDANALNL